MGLTWVCTLNTINNLAFYLLIINIIISHEIHLSKSYYNDKYVTLIS